MGYWGSFITFMGASIFWISTIVGVPKVLPDESVHYVEWDILFWLTQVSWNCTFSVSSACQEIELRKWTAVFQSVEWLSKLSRCNKILTLLPEIVHANKNES